MGYCDGDCEYLEKNKRHSCAKYGMNGTRLGYMKQTGSISFSVHEQCELCNRDKWIDTLESKLKCNFVNNKCLHVNCKNCEHGEFSLIK